MDPEHVLSPQHSVHYTPETFCETLHKIRPDVQHGIFAAQWRKRLHLGREYLTVVFEVVPLDPAWQSAPRKSARHGYIEVGRFDDQIPGSYFGLWGYSRDEITVIGQEELAAGYDIANYCDYEATLHPNLPGRRIASLFWGGGLPNLIDMVEFIALLSFMYPHYNILTRPRKWLANIIFGTLWRVYLGHEHIKAEFWRQIYFTPGLSDPRLLAIAHFKQDCRETVVESVW